MTFDSTSIWLGMNITLWIECLIALIYLIVINLIDWRIDKKLRNSKDSGGAE